jgi:hypothetical protein
MTQLGMDLEDQRLGPRRYGLGRRSFDDRRSEIPLHWPGDERRSRERRRSKRRAGRDRRN